MRFKKVEKAWIIYQIEEVAPKCLDDVTTCVLPGFASYIYEHLEVTFRNIYLSSITVLSSLL